MHEQDAMDDAGKPIGFRKMLVRLQRDEDGYPPVDIESLWVSEPERARYRIENIPFYVTSLGLGDVVSGVESNGELWIGELITPSNHGVLRIVAFDEGEIEDLRSLCRRHGCSSELHRNLIAVDVPPTARQSIDRLLDELARRETANEIGYEVACKTW